MKILVIGTTSFNLMLNHVKRYISNSKLPKSKKILVTGTAGFMGFHLAKKLQERGDTVVGVRY